MHSKTCQTDTEVQLSKRKKTHIYCPVLAWQEGLEELCELRQKAINFSLPSVAGSILMSCEHLSHVQILHEKPFSL